MWVVIIIIVIIGWWYFANLAAPTASTTPSNGVNNAPLGAQTDNSSASAVIPVAGLTTPSSDSSNAALNSDLSSIDAQATGLSDDSSNINQSLDASTSMQ